MATVNPFYRFEDAPEVASMAQGAKRISYATGQLYAAINNFYTGLSVNSVLSSLRNNEIPLFNLNYNANFIAERVSLPSGSTTAQIYVYDQNIITQYPLLRISMVFEVDGSGLIINNATFFIGYVNEYYSYASPLLEGEKEAYRALINNNENRPALFPSFYKFDPLTGLATSYVARFKNCLFDSNLQYPTRDPFDILPRGGANLVKLPALNAAGKYILGLFDQLINYAQQDGVVYADITAKYQTWTLPDGFNTVIYEDSSTAQRFQIDVFDTNGSEGFTLILREEANFVFQRFYAPFYSSELFLVDYVDTLTLPYEPDLYKVRYYNAFYDYDLCLFDDCQFPAKEIYRMPAKSGDVFKFNVLPEIANTETQEFVKVGLFDIDGNLIQQIGENQILECGEFEFTTTLFTRNFSSSIVNGVPEPNIYTPTDETWFASALLSINLNLFGSGTSTNTLYVYAVDAFNNTDPNPIFQFSTGLGDPAYDLDFASPVTFCTTLQTAFATHGITVTYNITNYEPPPAQVAVQKPRITLTFKGNLCCVSQFRFGWNNTFILGESTLQYNYLYEYGPLGQSQFSPTQQFCNALIPAEKNGCYRLGLYNKESALEGLESYFESQSLISSTNYIALVDDLGIAQFLVAIPSQFTTTGEIYDWIAAGNASFFTLGGGFGNLRLSIYPYVTLLNWTIQVGSYDWTFGAFTGITFLPTTLPATGQTNIDELYALSNPIEIDNSDCFSSIIQYYGEDNSVVTAFEYLDSWYQQIRLGINGGGQKPVLNESLYRQSNGVHKRPVSKQDLSVDLHTDFLDLETQSALVDATRHPFFVWKDQSLFVTGDIEVATVQDFSTQSSFEDLAQVKFSALKQGYQPKSSTCVNC